jgi:uncharacterized integral membrane protein
MNDISDSGPANGPADDPKAPPGSSGPDSPTSGGAARSGGAAPTEPSARASRRSEPPRAGDTGPVEPEPRPPTPITQQIGRGVVVLLAIVFGVFAVANSQHVAFSWLFGETRVLFDAQGERVTGGVPLIILMIASLAIGIAVGAAWVRLAERARRRRKD